MSQADYGVMGMTPITEHNYRKETSGQGFTTIPKLKACPRCRKLRSPTQYIQGRKACKACLGIR